MTIKGIIRRTIEFQELSRWAEEHPDYGLQRPFLEPLRAVLRRKKTTVQKRLAVKAYVGGGRLLDAGEALGQRLLSAEGMPSLWG